MLSAELWRLAALTLAALTGIVAFAAGVRPLAEGQLSPFDALRFMSLALIPMLQFTAPFAAGFAATLVYHRFAADNEHLAASAGGVSHRASLGPAVGLGLTLAIIVAGLAHFVIPKFLRTMQELVTRDVAHMLINSIEQGESVEFSGMAVHADRAIRGEADPRLGVTDRLFLTGVLALETDDTGAIKAEVAAELAEVLLTTERQNGEPVTVVHMRLEGAVGKQQNEGLGEVGSIRLRPRAVPNAFDEDPGFFTLTELDDLKRQPEMHDTVDLLRRRLAAALTARRAERLLVAAISGESRIVLTDGLGQRVAVGAPDLRREGARWRLIPPDSGVITIDQSLADGSRRSQTAARAWISVRADQSAGPATITLELEDVATRDSTGARRQRLVFEQLRLAADPGAEYFDAPVAELLTQADHVIDAATDDPEIDPLRDARALLQSRVNKLGREIIGIHNERTALAIACFVMTLCGAIIALRLRDSTPLHVYLWSFFPALGAVITISGGENAASQNLITGLIVLWGGVAALAAFTVFEYLKLRRH